MSTGVTPQSLRPKAALLSMSDTRGLQTFAQGLSDLKWRLFASSGTAQTLKTWGLTVTEIRQLTGFCELLGGRVKTLIPEIHAGILADEDELPEIIRLGIQPFDLVAVTLYPFSEKKRQGGENLRAEIDIGGTALLRAAAKSWPRVTVLCAPEQYPETLTALRTNGTTSAARRRSYAAQVFAHTAQQDQDIAAWLTQECKPSPAPATQPPNDGDPNDRVPDDGDPNDGDPNDGDPKCSAPISAETWPATITLVADHPQPLSYGDNPHQKAALYRLHPQPHIQHHPPSCRQFHLLQGAPASANNLLDASAALSLVDHRPQPAAAIIKHGSPCGCAQGADPTECLTRALACDPESRFGGVVGLNHACSLETAQILAAHFLTAVVAPSFTPKARAHLASKPNLRLLKAPEPTTPFLPAKPHRHARLLPGALLLQDHDACLGPEHWTIHGPPLTDKHKHALSFAQTLAQHCLSNAVVITTAQHSLAIGSGQPSRIGATRIALHNLAQHHHNNRELKVAASDGFFPFPDALDLLISAGVTTVLHPGGGQKDGEIIRHAKAKGCTLVTTKRRHFRH